MGGGEARVGTRENTIDKEPGEQRAVFPVIDVVALPAFTVARYHLRELQAGG